ncbi:MAG TPA: glycosyltransferase family 4 protein, partial [Actinomycetota bacterium]|nr:glycosyltransferase family 4 protein [Actinomycetota bacterium]
MRIALVCPYAWDAPGGVQVHVRQLARRLRERGHDVLVVAPARDGVEERDVAIVGRTIGIPINGSVAPVCLALASARKLRSALHGFRPDGGHV